MMANAHCQLHLELNPGPNFTWTDHYWFGTSTANQRIESWWRQMSKGQTLAWKVCSGYPVEVYCSMTDKSAAELFRWPRC
jgi:beta-glucosidase/6-phospho-beta-glucosidase/beta-galactosidase